MLVHDLLDRSLYIPFSHESMQEVVAILSTCLKYYLATHCLRFLSVVLRNYLTLPKKVWGQLRVGLQN